MRDDDDYGEDYNGEADGEADDEVVTTQATIFGFRRSLRVPPTQPLDQRRV